MISVEIKNGIHVNDDGSDYEREYLEINGIADEISFFFKQDTYSSANFYNEKVVEILLNHTFNEVSEHFTSFTFHQEIDFWTERLEIDVVCKKYKDHIVPKIQIMLQFDDWEHWAKAWSMSSFANEFEVNLNNINNNNLKYFQSDPESMLNGFGIEYIINDTNKKINDELNFLFSILQNVIEETSKNLLEHLDKDAIHTFFQFPEEIKTACKQYLVYFTQFIADIGISVNTEIKEEANQTLFKVSPKNKTEGLQKIREALKIYLEAVGHPNFESEAINYSDVSVKQWQANVYHLKSQMMLSSATIQFHQATIEAQALTIFQYKQLVESKDYRKNKSEEEEDIIKGIVSVKKYEGKGFSINLAEILRRLKRNYKKITDQQ